PAPPALARPAARPRNPAAARPAAGRPARPPAAAPAPPARPRVGSRERLWSARSAVARQAVQVLVTRSFARTRGGHLGERRPTQRRRVEPSPLRPRLGPAKSLRAEDSIEVHGRDGAVQSVLAKGSSRTGRWSVFVCLN